jgi:hypothetical protein
VFLLKVSENNSDYASESAEEWFEFRRKSSSLSMTEIYFAGFNGAGHSILVFLLKVSENNSHYYINSTGDCKIIGNRATVFNDFSVVNWYKNPLKSVARFPIILQIAVGERLPKSGFL